MCSLGFIEKVGMFENWEVCWEHFVVSWQISLLDFCCSEQQWHKSALACTEGECGFSVWNPEQLSYLLLPWKTGIFMTQYWIRRAGGFFSFLDVTSLVSNSDVFLLLCLPLSCCIPSIAASVSWGLFAVQSPSLWVSQATHLEWEGNVTLVYIMGTISSHLHWAVLAVYTAICGYT